jgi:hypothetical protein
MDAKAIEMLVTNLPDDYEEICIMEARATIALQKAEDALEYERDWTIIDARNDGQLNGKSADERAFQIARLLDDSNSVHWLAQYAAARKVDLAAVTAERKSMEMRAGLLKAWLYSQSGKE